MTTTSTWYSPALGTGKFLIEGQLFINPAFKMTTDITDHVEAPQQAAGGGGMSELAQWADPPGYKDALAQSRFPRYGWAVITSPSGSSGGKIAVIPVIDWELAKRTYPYQWLNSHPNQPAPISETLRLAEETWAKRRQPEEHPEATP